MIWEVMCCVYCGQCCLRLTSVLPIVFQVQGVLQEYLLAMTTDEQLHNHTAMVRLLVFFFALNNTDSICF